MSVVVTTTEIEPERRRPRTSEMVCLPLDYIAGFLFGVNADRVKPELRERVILYQRECYRVLADAFFTRGISVPGRLSHFPSEGGRYRDGFFSSAK
jgi:hypothetical protein